MLNHTEGYDNQINKSKLFKKIIFCYNLTFDHIEGYDISSFYHRYQDENNNLIKYNLIILLKITIYFNKQMNNIKDKYI